MGISGLAVIFYRIQLECVIIVFKIYERLEVSNDEKDG